MITQLWLPQLLHRCFWRNKLVILVYHGVIRSPLIFNDWCFLDEFLFFRQIKYLKRNFQVLHLREAVEIMKSGRMRVPTAVITFDDGYQNNYDIAFPILRAARLPATIFLTTGLVNTDNTFWNLRLARALARATRPLLEWDGQIFDISAPGPKSKTSLAIQAKLGELPRARLQEEVRRIILLLNDDPDSPVEADSPFRMLNREAIEEMSASGLIEFGAHTHTHPILTHLSPEEQYHEIKQSITAIHALTGHPCELFAYPNGTAQDYSTDSIKILQRCGVRLAVTGIPEPNDGMTSPMELRRHGVGANESMAIFQMKVHHFLAQLRRVRVNGATRAFYLSSH